MNIYNVPNLSYKAVKAKGVLAGQTQHNNRYVAYEW